eukprot:621477-Amphidinium_carterae.1
MREFESSRPCWMSYVTPTGQTWRSWAMRKAGKLRSTIDKGLHVAGSSHRYYRDYYATRFQEQKLSEPNGVGWHHNQTKGTGAEGTSIL